MLTAMICCAYCEHAATMTIWSNPERVCFEHALEFWNGLLVYTRDRALCVEQSGPCSCRMCEELMASALRAAAIAASGPSPGDHEDFTIRLAS
jgi:hypothetical protein